MFGKKKNTPQDPSRGRDRSAVVSARTPGAGVGSGAPSPRSPIGGSQVFSYHANRSVREASLGRDNIEAEPPKRRTRRRPKLRLAQVIPLVVLAVVLLMSLSLSSKPKVVTVGDGSGEVFLRSTQAYSAAASKLFGSSLFNTNKLTVNATQISAELSQEFPELEVVSISLPVLGRQPIVYVQPAIPQLTLATQQGRTYVVDNHGRALIDAAQASNLATLHIPAVIDQSGLQITAGAVALPSASATFIGQIAAQLRAKSIAVSAYNLTGGGNELDAHIGGTPYFVKFNVRGDAREEAGTFLATKQQLDAQHKAPGQYMDARIPGKVYYK